MPAKRLPWIKFYPELLEHEKFAELSDSESWTWVNIWGKASQQPVRWRFASVQHAGKVTGRPLPHIRRLIAARLLDEREDGVWVHDWQQWQNRYPSDYEDSPSEAGTLPEDSANAPPILREDSANGAANTPASLPQSPSRAAERAKTKKGDIELSYGEAQPAPIPKPNRGAEVINAIRALGIEPNLTDRDHKAIKDSTAKPTLIAEVYGAVYSGDYGDPFMQQRLCVREAIGWIDGYCSRKANGIPQPVRAGRPEPPRHVIDRTGVDN